jgi:hypothetical protein
MYALFLSNINQRALYFLICHRQKRDRRKTSCLPPNVRPFGHKSFLSPASLEPSEFSERIYLFSGKSLSGTIYLNPATLRGIRPQAKAGFSLWSSQPQRKNSVVSVISVCSVRDMPLSSFCPCGSVAKKAFDKD